MGVGRASGKNKCMEAAVSAINSPLLETSIDGATAVLVSFTVDGTVGLKAIHAAADMVQSLVDEDADFIFGANVDESLTDEAQVTVVATGMAEVAPSLPASRKPVRSAGNVRELSRDSLREKLEPKESLLDPVDEPRAKDINAKPSASQPVRDQNKIDYTIQIPGFLTNRDKRPRR
jgi:cell division protein FtsZ